MTRHASGLDVTELAHPLLLEARANEVGILPGRGIVITGSNMSGKAALLRAVGANAILVQTIHTCIATRFACPPLVVRTAIALADKPLGGEELLPHRSHFARRRYAPDSRAAHWWTPLGRFSATFSDAAVRPGSGCMAPAVSPTLEKPSNDCILIRRRRSIEP